MNVTPPGDRRKDMAAEHPIELLHPTRPPGRRVAGLVLVYVALAVIAWILVRN